MQRLIRFVVEVTKKSTLAFFITLSVVSALVFPFIFMLIMIAALASPEPATTTDLDTTYVYGNEDSENKLLQIPINGVILNSQDNEEYSWFSDTSNTYGYTIKKTLRDAAADTSIQGIILSIDSPGGTVTGSQAIADGIAYYKDKTKKPVFAHIRGLGASGAYWVAVGGDKIYADTGSSIGSIGVINGEIYHFKNVTRIDGGLLAGGIEASEGIDSYVISSGKGKDFGNPFRAPTAEELQILQAGSDANYNVFVNRVSTMRGIEEGTVRNNIGAYIYDNSTAEEKKLIDGTASRESVYTGLAKAASITDYQVVAVRERRSRLDTLLGASSYLKQMTKAASQKDSMSAIKSQFCVPQVAVVYHGDISSVCN